MKKLLLEGGRVRLCEVPGIGEPDDHELKVRLLASALSPGSEQALIVSSGFNPVQSSNRFRQALDYWRQRGIGALVEKISEKLHMGHPVGYSAAGIVVACGRQVSGFAPGDRVACSGNQFAHHAEEILASSRLCVKIPHGVSFEEASTATLGAIALNALRQLDVRLGETIAIVGMGALGQIAAQLSRAAGARVIGIDRNARRLSFAHERGWIWKFLEPSASSPAQVFDWTRGHGVDGVVLALHAPADPAPIEFAARILRRRGRLTILGDVPVALPRSLFYEKDLKLNIAVSYGPGRYDPDYEERGVDYPETYVRWTAARNMACYLELISDKRLDVNSLVQAVYPIEKAEEAYAQLAPGASQAAILTLLTYGYANGRKADKPMALAPQVNARPRGRIGLGIIGAGGFASSTHLPLLSKLSELYEIRAICNRHPEKSWQAARKFGARACSSPAEIFSDQRVNAVLIATRHQTHALLAREALAAGKAVFLEKPLAVTIGDLENLERVYHDKPAPFHIGFNRRFSPLVQQLKFQLKDLGKPWMIQYRVAAESLPASHWIYEPLEGGRVIGELCHMIDLVGYLIGSTTLDPSVGPSDCSANSLNGATHLTDALIVTLRYSQDVMATIQYQASSPGFLGKERLEITGTDGAIVLEDFKRLKAHVRGKDFTIERDAPAKGFEEQWRLLARYFGGISPSPLISFDEAAAVTRLTFFIDQEIRRVSSV
ncbi:MAG: bi-domain-containing oxidoreductase [Elusimicrobia bacterium]|nr:bi-domain-containing oxidoreductase [Elusimicrobiota bacterium]